MIHPSMVRTYAARWAVSTWFIGPKRRVFVDDDRMPSASVREPRGPGRSTDPTLEQAVVFCALADAAVAGQGMVAAAHALGHSDTKKVSGLLARFGNSLNRGPLIARPGRGKLELTAAGVEVLPWARQFVSAATNMRERPADIRFSAFPSVAARVVRVLARHFEAPADGKDPRLVLHGVTESSRNDGGRGLVRRVISGEVDLVIAPSDLTNDTLMERPLYQPKLRIALPAEHPLSSAAEITPTQLRDLHIMAAPKGHVSRGVLDDAFADAHVHLDIALESTDQHVLHDIASMSRHFAAAIPGDAFRDLDEAFGPVLRSGGHSMRQYSLYQRPEDSKRGASTRGQQISDFANEIYDSFKSQQVAGTRVGR